MKIKSNSKRSSKGSVAIKRANGSNWMAVKALTGAQAMAHAMRQINPDVVAAYPITPQTPIVEQFSQFVADGDVDTELIRVESEHSAMSAVIGASAAGARAMTATSSVGLALMFEVVNVASGLRLPIVMGVVNRSLSAPINIHADHSDSMACRDAGWVQLYSENAQEVYENALLALKIAESENLPVMVIQDGFITSHAVKNVRLLKDSVVKKYAGSYKPSQSLFFNKNPLTVGALELFDYFFETKRQQEEAMNNVYRNFNKTCKELTAITGNHYAAVEPYQLRDADAAVVVLNSTAGTTKVVVDNLRKRGLKVGMLKIRLFRPFPHKEVLNALKNVKSIAVLDRSMSFGSNAPVYSEVMNSLYYSDKRPKIFSYVFGLGGRDIFEKDIEKVFLNILKQKNQNKVQFIGLRE